MREMEAEEDGKERGESSAKGKGVNKQKEEREKGIMIGEWWWSMRGWEWHLIRCTAPAKGFCQLRTTDGKGSE